MKNTNIRLICAALVVSLIFGLAAPLDESVQRAAARGTTSTATASSGACAPFVYDDLRYAELELRPGAAGRRPGFAF